MRQNGEASVEEILESIKKVIARDNRAGAAELRRQRESDGLPDSADEDEILDLGAADFVEEAPGFERRDDFEPAEADEGEDAPLTTEEVRSSMRDNFAALAMLAEPGARPQIVRSGETSLEGLVREMLRPMLAQWLDAHLPGMVEKMVQAEIARIAGKRG
jgi:cell pole-organizing protein PopZ